MFRLSLLYFWIIIIGELRTNDNKRDNYYDKDTNGCYNEEKPYAKYEKESNEECEEKYFPLSDSIDYFSKTQLINTLINNSINPCNNFYEYTCGIWDSSLMSSTKNCNQYIYYRLNKLLKKESKYDQLPFIKMAKRLYQSCIDEDALEKRGLKPMQQMLDATGGWPILMSDEEWNAKNYPWQLVDSNYFKLYSFSTFFDISYQTDYENAGILMIRPFPQYPLSKKLKIDIQQSPYDLKTANQIILNETGKYRKTIMKVVRAFAKDKGIKISNEKLRMNVKELIEFEINLEKIVGHMKKIHEIIPTTGEKMTIAQLQEYYDLAGARRFTAKINWLHTIQIAFTNLFNKIICNSETVLVFHKEILHELVYLLDATPQYVIVNYLQWHVVRIFMNNLNKKMRNIELKYYYSHDIYLTNKIYNEMKLKQRWVKCIEEFQMKDALSYLYVKTYISANNMQTVSSIFEDVKNEMIDYMKYSMRQNKLTKLMIQKIYNISLHIDYPEGYDNQTVLAEVYKGLKIDDNYFTNVLAIIKNKNILRPRNFRESKHRDKSLYRWSLDLLSGNPNYDEQSNVISIPAAMMQSPYFSLNAPIAANYGAIGSIIGQLLVRSAYLFIESYIDDYDYLTLKTEIRQAFEEGSYCLIKLYRKSYIPYILYIMNRENLEYIELYENLVKDDIVAHFIGIQVASAAFQKRKTISLPQLVNGYRSYKATAKDIYFYYYLQSKLPTINFTEEQLFFLFNTLLICGTTNPYEDLILIEYVKTQIATNLARIKTFSEAFNCTGFC